jgi:type I restriction enzyme, S subunit
MMVNIAEIIEKKIDKSKWVELKFSNICENIVEKVVPKKSNLNHYIGLKHLDSGSLKIRRYGQTSNLDGDKLKIYKGDIIFAKRNAYLKRVSIADFDAVASAHSMVLRAKSKNISPQFLPFFLLSDLFWQKAIEISVGSLSPTINWKSLAKQQFSIPPIDQQVKLSKILWSLNNLIEKEKELHTSLDIFFRSKIKYISNNHTHIGEYKKISEVCTIKDNLRIPLNSKQRDNIKGDVPYYGANGPVDSINKHIFDEDLVLIAEDGGNFKEFYSKEIAYRVSGKSWVNNHAHVLSVKNKLINTEWLLYSLMHKNILKSIIGTTRLKLNKSELENIEIWVPSNKIIKLLSEEIKKINISRKQALEKLKLSTYLQKIIINKVFNVI